MTAPERREACSYCHPDWTHDGSPTPMQELCTRVQAALEARDAEIVDLILERDGVKHSRVCPNHVVTGDSREQPCLRCRCETLTLQREASIEMEIKAKAALDTARLMQHCLKHDAENVYCPGCMKAESDEARREAALEALDAIYFQLCECQRMIHARFLPETHKEPGA